MSSDEQFMQEVRKILATIAGSLEGIALALDTLPNRDELLLTQLLCAHVRVAGTCIDDRTLYGLYDIVERIKMATRCDVSKIPGGKDVT